MGKNLQEVFGEKPMGFSPRDGRNGVEELPGISRKARFGVTMKHLQTRSRSGFHVAEFVISR